MDCIIDKNKVHEIMCKRGILTQQDLADKMKITKNQLSVTLSEKTNPFKSSFTKLCSVLDVSPVELLLEKEKTYIQTDMFQDKEMEYCNTAKVVPCKKYHSLELFAGAGGLALGLEEAGFQEEGLIEIDKYATETLRINRPNWNVIEEDIIKVAENNIKTYLKGKKDIDMISGGYPCQAFSYAGNKMGLSDVRGTMFYYFAQIIDQLKPKLFLAENVKGLINHDGGKTIKTMIAIYEDLGYNVSYHLLKAVNYNVAQKRERVIIVGIQNKYAVKYRPPKPFDHQLVLRDVLKDVPDSIGEKYSQKKKEVLKLIPPGGYWKDLPEDIAKAYMGKSYYSGGGRTGMARRLSWDEPSLTLTCSPAQKQTERCHPDEIRPFTVREYARIQSFPDQWAFYGSMGQQYKQIGNAVPVALAKVIGLSLIDVLNQIERLSQ
ncbi:MAG: DNA (cytosine-5-)-methyltransferase [Eubacterium sp.]